MVYVNMRLHDLEKTMLQLVKVQGNLVWLKIVLRFLFLVVLGINFFVSKNHGDMSGITVSGKS